MARTIQKITLNQAENIPFDKLVLSQKNVRRVKNGVSIDDLAEDIARRGLLQSLNVRIERDADGHETGRYEVPAGGRRFMACERLIAQKRMAGTAPVPCIVNRAESTSAEEDSLAENVHREQLASARPVPGLQDTQRPGPRHRGDRRPLLRVTGHGQAAPEARLGVAEAARSLRRGQDQAGAGDGDVDLRRSCPPGAGVGEGLWARTCRNPTPSSGC